MANMAEVFLGDLQFPIAPENINVKIKNQNKTLTLIDGAEINVPNPAGLTEYKLSKILLPSGGYTFAGGITYQPHYYLGKLKEIKYLQDPVNFVLNTSTSGVMEDGNSISAMVTVEDYDYTLAADEADNIELNITLKKYVAVATSVIEVKSEGKAKNTKTKNRTEKTQAQQTTYTVKKGDTLWAIAKKFYGDGSKYTAIYNANRDKISNPNLIYPGQVLVIPDASTAAKTTSKSTSSSNSSSSTKKGTTYTSASDSVTIKSSKKATQLQTLADRDIDGMPKVKQKTNYHKSAWASTTSSGNSGSHGFGGGANSGSHGF